MRSHGSGSPPSSARHLDGTLEGAVGDHDRSHAAGEQLAGRQLAHGAGADQEGRLVLEPVEDAARELDRRRADRHGLLRDASLAADALRDRERLVEAAVQHLSRRPIAAAARVLLLQLAEDLRLSDHQRVEARRDAEEVADRVAPDVRVEVRGERGRADAVLVREVRREGRAEPGGIGAAGDDLDAVARRHDGRFGDPLERHEASQRLVELPVREREALAQLDRGRAVVQTDDDDAALHDPRTCRGSPARGR
jgi:hypothetical protein